MKKLAVTLLRLLFLAVVAILIGVYVTGNAPKNQVDSTDVAINIALEDAKSKEALQQIPYKFVPITRPNDPSAGRGFIGYPGNLVGVYVQSTPQSGPPPLVNYYYIIDTNRSRIVDISSWLDLPSGDDVTIPPGVAWYYRVISDKMGFGGIDPAPRTGLRSSYAPADANVTQVLVSEEGLRRLMNLSKSTPVCDIDVPREVTVYNQSETRGPDWNAGITWPAVIEKEMPGVRVSDGPFYQADSNYYIVVVNRETNREVRLSLWASTGSTW